MEEVSDIFVQYKVLQYIEECFELFHVEGDEAILDDIMVYLRNKGAAYDETIGK